MAAYYNEIDPYAAQWLRNLIAVGHIAPGDVDERSIEDVRPDDLAEYVQCHFFAGIGIWSGALRAAGWPDDRPVWTGSCPCQPFSAAGKGAGFADERHLWPAWFHLIEQRRPPVVLGEQVASKDGLAWLDLVHVDLEGASYAIGATDLCAAGVGAPHIRQRLWFVGVEHTAGDGRFAWRAEPGGRSVAGGCGVGGLADSNIAGLERRLQPRNEGPAERSSRPGGVAGRLAYTDGAGCSARQWDNQTTRHGHSAAAASGNDRHGRPVAVNGFWRNADWLRCRDERWRPVEAGTFPLAHGDSGRVGKLRAYGNAITLPVAQTFIESVMEIA